MEEVEVWIARDKDGTLNIFPVKPLRTFNRWENYSSDDKIELSFNDFPNVKWEDKEPTKSIIKLVK